MAFRREAGVGLLVLALALVAHGGEAKAVQLVNPGFEIDADGDKVPDGWAKVGAARVTVDSEVKKEGKRALRVESRRAAACRGVQSLNLEPGTVYRVSGWVKTEDYSPVGGAQIRATISVRVHASGQLIECGREQEGTTDWVKETMDFIVPGTGVAVVACEYASGGTATGVVWFDGLELERLADPGRVETITEAPHGCHVRAEWALRRDPPDWAALAAAVESFYSQGAARVRGNLGGYLRALATASEANPDARLGLVKLYGKHAWRIDLGELAGRDIRPLLQEAIGRAAKDPKKKALAHTASVGLARLTAVYGDGSAAAAAKSLREAVAGREREQQELVGVLLRDVAHLRRKQEEKRAKRVCEALMTFVPPDSPRRVEVEMANLGLLMALGNVDAARAAAEKLAAPGVEVPLAARRDALLVLSRLSVAAGKTKETQQWLARADEEFSRNRDVRASFYLDLAKTLAKKNQRGQAAAVCERLVATLPDQPKACFEAQALLTRCSLEERRHDEAIGAAKVLYGVAPNSEKEITEAVNLVVQALKAKYRSIALANRFVAFQSHGPDGEDGKKGTEDDVENPLAKVKWTPPPEIESLFRKTLAGLPQDFQGRRWRGYLYLYWGKPELALKEFAWRFDHAPLEQKAVDEAINDLVVALKACCGHTLAGECFMDYQKYGPEGRDGKAGTPDDLRDPIKESLGSAK